MISKIEDFDKTTKQLKEEYPKLSDFEILTLSIQIERNQILKNSLYISRNDKGSSRLEAIQDSLGYTDKLGIPRKFNM